MLSVFVAVMTLLAGQAAPPVVEDRWISASPDRMTADPCMPEIEGPEGTSAAWLYAMMLERGHPRALICGESRDFEPAVISRAEADWLDLGAQAMARTSVRLEALMRTRVPEPWGPASEEISREFYLQLKADDYRELRELHASEGDPSPVPQ